MAGNKFEGVVEAVHYTPEGKIAWVRVYERRGAAFSDLTIVDRQSFIERLKSGRRYVVGRRIPLMAGTFETFNPIQYIVKNGDGILIAGDQQADRDKLDGALII